MMAVKRSALEHRSSCAFRPSLLVFLIGSSHLFLFVSGQTVINPTVLISFQQSNYAVNEADGNLKVTLIATNLATLEFKGSINVTIRTSPPLSPEQRPATLFDTIGGDYTLTGDLSNDSTTIISFTEGVTTVDHTLIIVGDNVYEGNEVFILEIVDIKVPDSVMADVIIGIQDKAEVIIIDDDILAVKFQTAAVTVKEGSFVDLMGETSESPFVVPFDIGVICFPIRASGIKSALIQEDYTHKSDLFLFFDRVGLPPPVVSSTQARVRAKADGCVEGPESFLCALQLSIAEDDQLQSVDPDTVTVTIMDSDSLKVEWDREVYEVEEDDGIVNLILQAQQPFSINFTLPATPQAASTLMIAGMQYNAAIASAGTLTGDYKFDIVDYFFSANCKVLITSVPGQLAIEDDDVLEGDEIFEVQFTIPGGIMDEFPISKGNRTTAFVVIKDNDFVTVSFANDSCLVAEEDGVIEITLKIEGKFLVNFSVTVECSPVSADIDDAELVNITVNVSPLTNALFAENIPNVTIVNPFSVVLKDDDKVENDEMFTCAIIEASHDGVRISSSNNESSLHCTIVDTDKITVAFSQTLYNSSEGQGYATVQVVVLEGQLSIPVTVQVFTSDLTNTSNFLPASAGLDYTALVGHQLTFQPGQNAISFNISIMDDLVPELTEYFQVNLANFDTSNDTVVIAQPSTLVAIESQDEFVSISLDQITYDIFESEESVEVCVALSASYFQDIIVSLEPTAIVGNPEYVAISADFDDAILQITVPSGSTGGCASIDIVDDALVERTENFTVEFTYTGAQEGVTFSGGSLATVNIKNDDTLLLMFDPSMHTFIEGVGQVNFTIVASSLASFDYNFIVTAKDISATIGLDYQFNSTTVYYTAGSGVTMFFVTANILGDSIFELAETFNLNLTTDMNFLSMGIITLESAIVTIQEGESIAVSFETSSYTVNEGGSVNLTIVTNSTLSMEIVVTVTLDHITTEDGDYVPGSFNVTIDPVTGEGVVTIATLPDNIIEGSEVFSATLSIPVPIPGVVTGDPSVAMVTIIDNTTAEVRFVSDMYSTVEGDSVTLFLELSADLAPNTTVEVVIVTADGSANDDSDYTPLVATTVLFTGRTASVVVMTTEDDQVEGIEDFLVNIVSIPMSSLNLGISIGNPSTATVDINDDDSVVVFLTMNVFTVREDAGFANITIQATKANFEAYIVVVTVTEGSATEGSDYTGKQFNVTFGPGDLVKMLRIPIIDDTILEVQESFSVSISLPSNVFQVTTGLPDRAEVNIEDEDTVTVSLSTSSITVGEGGNVTVTVLINGESSVPFDVTISLSDISTTGSADYMTGDFPFTFTITPGQTEYNVTIVTTDDTEIECDESLMADLSVPPSSSSLGVQLGSPSQTEVTITDDDGPVYVSFVSAEHKVEEGGTVGVLLKCEPADFDFQFNVTLMFVDQEAMEGSDYIAAPEVVTIQSNTANHMFAVETVGDDVAELLERFSIKLTSISVQDCVGGLVEISNDLNTTFITIEDDDELIVSIDPTTFTVTEGGVATFSIVTNIPHDFEVQVTLATVNGTATGGVDFGTIMTTIVLPPSLNTPSMATVTIVTLPDTIVEGSEEFTVVISKNDGDPFQVSPDNATISILDDSSLVVSLTQSSISVTEGGDAVITVRVTGDFSVPFDVTISLEDITAEGSMDYVNGTFPFTFTITPGQTEYNVTIVTTDDTEIECDESLRANLSVPPSSSSLGVQLGSPSQTEVTITDNDGPLEVCLKERLVEVMEGEKANITLVTNSADHRLSFTLTLAYKDMSAVLNKDYLTLTDKVVFKPGQQEATVQVDTVDNGIAELLEMFSIMITLDSPCPTVVTCASRTDMTVNIKDDDDLVVSIIPDSVNVKEDASFTVDIVTNVPYDFEFEVILTYANGTAKAGIDFNAVTTSVVFGESPDSPGSNTVTITTLEDGVIEGTETFSLFLLGSRPITVSNSSTTVNILDGTVVKVAFESESYDVTEGNTANVVLYLLPGSSLTMETNISIRVFTSDRTAISPDDYQHTVTILTFSSGVTEVTAAIQTDDDSEFEVAEIFQVDFEFYNVADDILTMEALPNTSVVMILDNDMLTVCFEQPVYTVKEDGGMLEVALVTSQSIKLNHNRPAVQILPINGSAHLFYDFILENDFIEFAVDSSRSTFQVLITDDTIFEGLEEFQLQLKITSYGDLIGLSACQNDTTIIFIEDNEPVCQVSFEEAEYVVPEDIGQVEVCLTRNCTDSTHPLIFFVRPEELAMAPLDIASGSGFSINEGPAIANDDFDDDSLMSMVQPGLFGLTNCVNITIIDDAIVEPTEFFRAVLFIPSNQTAITSGEFTLIDIDVPIRIIDDDNLTVSFERVRYATKESFGMAEVKIVVNGIASYPFDVNISGMGVTATEDLDFVFIPAVLTFQPGETMKIVLIPIINDNITEQNETFTLTINVLPQFQPAISIGTIKQTEVIIFDDVYIVTFDPVNYRITEGDSVMITAVLDGPAKETVTVQVMIMDISISDSDISSSSRVIDLTFDPGMIAVNFTVSSILDELCECEETFKVVFLDPTDDLIVIGTDDTAYVTIVDNEACSVTVQTGEVIEGEVAMVTLNVTGTLVAPLNVTLETRNGDAMASSDYVPQTVIVAIQPGQKSVVIKIQTLTDSEREMKETFDVIVTTADCVGGVNQQIGTIPIIDNTTEFVQVQFEKDLYTVKEGEDFTVRIIAIDNTVSQNFEVIVQPINGTAEGEGVDFNSERVTVMILAGSTESVVSFSSPTDDGVFEGVETFTLVLQEPMDSRVLLGNPNVATVQIIDMQSLQVYFASVNLTVSEDHPSSSVLISISATNPASFEYSVVVTPIADTALGGEDFTATPLIATFAPGKTSVTVRLNITDDDVLEDFEERLFLDLMVDPSVADKNITIKGPVRTMVTILDNDVEVFFSETKYEGTEEDGNVIITVLAEGHLRETFCVNVITENGTAFEIKDFTAGPHKVTFGPDVTLTSFPLPITRDSEDEEAEHFTIHLIAIQPHPESPSIAVGKPSTATVIITDKGSDTQTRSVNTTITGDPLFTVPVSGNTEDIFDMDMISLCYEIHGTADRYFNLISDACVSVNALFQAATPYLNVMSEISIKTEGNNGSCHQISVSLDSCGVTLNGEEIESVTIDGVAIRKFIRRVYVSVPNCGDNGLAMFIHCMQRQLRDPVTNDPVTVDLIQFRVARGLGLAPSSHGLAGQFWNIPLEFSPYLGPFTNGKTFNNYYSVRYFFPEHVEEERTFTGMYYKLNWELERRPCIYVGNRQGGPVYEIADKDFNDAVIEGVYSDYIMRSAFSHTFKFSQFTSQC